MPLQGGLDSGVMRFVAHEQRRNSATRECIYSSTASPKRFLLVENNNKAGTPMVEGTHYRENQRCSAVGSFEMERGDVSALFETAEGTNRGNGRVRRGTTRALIN